MQPFTWSICTFRIKRKDDKEPADNKEAAEEEASEKEAQLSEKSTEEEEEEPGNESILNGSVDLFDDNEPSQDQSVIALQTKLAEWVY